MQKIRIDFDNPGLPQHISAVENDSQSRFFQAVLYENGKAYTAPEGAAYSIMYRGFGPQNQGWYDTINDGAGKRAACAVSGNVVTCEIARQALQVPGHVSIVLCVTTGKGYMLKSWPIECDCKNDRYDSTAEIESFFYVTSVSNASWMQAIQALEELKNTIDPTLSLSGKAADAKATGDAVGQLKEEIVDINDTMIVKKNETFSGKDIDWINGFYAEDGTIILHILYKHTRVFKVEPETKVTYAYLRSPANYSPYIACFKNGVYIKESSLLGDEDANYKSGEFTIPQNIDGISFVSYDAPNDERLSISGIFLYYKTDVNAEKIESIETNIQHMESDIAGNYNQIYNVKKYTITDGIDIKGKYYDKNGKLQPADNLSTTGILIIPYGIKSIEYTAYRNVTIPTILFLSADMKVAGMVIATTSPAYGDTIYSGTAEIPPDAVYMEFSVANTNNDSSVTVIVSNIESNQKRIETLEKEPLYGKKITCTGNSITAATHSVPGHGYVEQIADAHGMTVDNHAIWGAIIPQGHPRANGDITDIGCIHDTLDSMDADADIVVMSGSINDCEYYSDASFLGEITGDFSSDLDLTTFYGALEDMCKKALQKWAGKPIIYVIEHRMTLDNTIYGQYYLKLHKAIVKVMNKWGISIVDLFNDCPSLNYNEGYKTKYTTGDGTHPNYEGYERFYVPRVYTEIKKLLGI